MFRTTTQIILALWIAGLATTPGWTCTNFLITKGASTDGSTIITYAADSHSLYGELYYTPAREHRPGEMLRVYEWDTGRYLLDIPQVPRTFSVVGNMNEHQVSIGETTYGGREKLHDPKGGIDYGSMMFIALQRARTAREAIQVMTGLTDTHGYCSEGETFSISDPNEVWIMDLIGKGPGKKGAVWVAWRVPDGYVSGHANQARIRQFPLNDPENCLYAKDVISFAREMDLFKGADADFSFVDAYAPADYGALRFCEGRVWKMFTRVAPSLKIPIDYVKGVPGAAAMPLWVKPDRKLSAQDVMDLMRDHFEDTEFDLSTGVGAGPFNLPYRWRPMEWEVDKQKYCHDRATSTQQTGFSFVSQARSWLPDPVGGIHWFGVDDTYSTVYIPMYCGIQAVPKPFAAGTGNFNSFSWDSAFWVFNFVSNIAYSRYSDMIKEIQVVQRELEGQFQAQVAEVDRQAELLHRQSPAEARAYLTRYSVEQGEQTVTRWRKLGEFLLWKFMDGNVRDELGGVTHPKYPEHWYRRIIKENPELYKVPAPPEAAPQH